MDKIIELTIDALSYGGRGVGRYDGKAVFVPSVLPGERVSCRILRDKKRYCEAELCEVLLASPDRREPLCRFFPECGGCQWQHLSYPLQMQWKEKIFAETIIRATGCDASLILPIIAAPDEIGYRCRAQIKCRLTAHGLIAGFYRAGSHTIVDTDVCPVLDPLIPPLLEGFRSCIAGYLHADKISQLDFCIDSAARSSLVVHFSGRDVSGLKAVLRELKSDERLSIYIQTGGHKIYTVVSGDEQAIAPEHDEELQLRFPPGGFIQINLEQNRRLVSEVLKSAVQSGGERILDLYAGIGNFSLPLAKKCSAVVGVEEYTAGVEAAIHNARDNSISNCQFIAGRSERVIQQMVNGPQFDTVVLDPPRSGAGQAIPTLIKLQPDRIVYVSCDPTTLARDLVKLIEGGYQLMSAQPVDMFPQTWHIEGIAVLSRSGHL
jgi:23S rRNA (uracil1939-C5)-methyltransferase